MRQLETVIDSAMQFFMRALAMIPSWKFSYGCQR